MHTAAAKFIASRRTNDFIEQANVEKGATPNTRDVAEEYMRQCSILGAHDLNPGLRRALEGSSRRNTANYPLCPEVGEAFQASMVLWVWQLECA